MTPTPIPNNHKIITFDFDQTLSKPHIQEYAKELIDEGYEVWVVTARFDELHKHSYVDVTWNNEDLWEVVDRIGLPRWKVRFMNMRPKYEYLQGTKAIWHLDDDHEELFDIKNNKLKTIGIQVNSGSWKQKCNRLLER